MVEKQFFHYHQLKSSIESLTVFLDVLYTWTIFYLPYYSEQPPSYWRRLHYYHVTILSIKDCCSVAVLLRYILVVSIDSCPIKSANKEISLYFSKKLIHIYGFLPYIMHEQNICFLHIICWHFSLYNIKKFSRWSNAI